MWLVLTPPGPRAHTEATSPKTAPGGRFQGTQELPSERWGADLEAPRGGLLPPASLPDTWGTPESPRAGGKPRARRSLSRRGGEDRQPALLWP